MENQHKIGVLTASLSRQSGGLYDAMRYLYRSMPMDVIIFGLEDDHTRADQSGWGSLSTHTFPVKLFRSFGWSPKLGQALKDTSLDVLHLHGLWMYPQYLSLKWQNRTKRPMVISSHGMLDPWAVKNSGWKKHLVGLWFAYKSLHKASCLHALCDSEYQAIRAYGLKNPVAVIPNGIHVPKPFNKRFNPKKRTLLFIGRIHPKKGLVLLLEALGLLKKDSDFFLNWNVKIAGWDQNGHLDELKKLVIKYQLTNDVYFLGPLFNEKKHHALLNADAFILPSYSEGLPMSVLEAWSYKLPVLMTEACNIPEGFAANAALKLELNAAQISNQLVRLNKLSETEYIYLSENGFDLVSNKFTWPFIAKQIAHLYDWLLGQGDRPEFVYLD